MTKRENLRWFVNTVVVVALCLAIIPADRVSEWLGALVAVVSCAVASTIDDWKRS